MNTPPPPKTPKQTPAPKTVAKVSPETEAEGPAWKKRRMIRGRWQDPEKARKTPRADRTFSIRVTEAELAEFDTQIETLGMKRNRALRIAMRRIGGFVEVDPATVAELRGINRQLGGIATNINQIARAANRTHDPDFQAFMKERAELGRALFEVRGPLQRILNLGARREDGLARLTEAAMAAAKRSGEGEGE